MSSYMGQDTQAAGGNVISASPAEYAAMAEAQLTGKSNADAANLVYARVFSAMLMMRSTKRAGPERFTTERVQMLLKQLAMAIAYVDAFIETRGMAAFGDRWAQIDKMLTEANTTWAELKQWNAAAGDAILMLQAEKRKALEAGNLEHPAFTDAERAWYKQAAAEGKMAYYGVPVTQEAEAAIAAYKAPARMRGIMGLVAVVAGGAALFLLTR